MWVTVEGLSVVTRLSCDWAFHVWAHVHLKLTSILNVIQLIILVRRTYSVVRISRDQLIHLLLVVLKHRLVVGLACLVSALGESVLGIQILSFVNDSAN